MRRIARTSAVLGAVLLAAGFAQSPASHAETSALLTDSRQLVVGTKPAPPFAMKSEDGAWRGISIDLWKRIAEQMHLRYRFQETTLEGLVDGVADGSLDLAVAALTVTTPRLRAVDFTLPFYSTGLGIAVVNDAPLGWWPVAQNIFSLGFLRAVAALFAVALGIGVLLWLLERRHNEHFGTHRAGFGSSLWWSAVTMTQSGGAAGDRTPRTLPGRLLAIVWMVASVIVIASFTAALTSQLTMKRLRGVVHDEADLRYVRTAAVSGTETTEYLDREHIAYRSYAEPEAGLVALQKGEIDALVYDRPLLMWMISTHFSGSLRVLPTSFDPQLYAIALPHGTTLRTPINLALFEVVRSEWWPETLFGYLGQPPPER